MDSTFVIRYGGRAAGAMAAVAICGKRCGTAGLILAGALGWLAGGYAADLAVAPR